MKKSKLRIGLLSLTVLVQGLTLVGGYFAYVQMSDLYYGLRSDYTKLLADCLRLYPTWGPLPPTFMFISLLVLFSMFLTIMLLADELNGRNC